MWESSHLQRSINVHSATTLKMPVPQGKLPILHKNWGLPNHVQSTSRKKNRFENIWDLRTVLAQIGTSGSSGREGHGAARTPLWHGCRPRPGWDPNQCPQHLWFRNDWHRASTGALQATTKKMNIVSQEQIKYRPWTYELTIIAYNCSNSDYFMKWLTGLQV
jgi:hypothetical protein